MHTVNIMWIRYPISFLVCRRNSILLCTSIWVSNVKLVTLACIARILSAEIQSSAESEGKDGWKLQDHECNMLKCDTRNIACHSSRLTDQNYRNYAVEKSNLYPRQKYEYQKQVRKDGRTNFLFKSANSVNTNATKRTSLFSVIENTGSEYHSHNSNKSWLYGVCVRIQHKNWY
jgi:hypothetical protein